MLSKMSIANNKYNENLNTIKEAFQNNYDVVYRELNSHKGSFCLIFIDNMCNAKYISDDITYPLIHSNPLPDNVGIIKKQILNANTVGDVNNISEAISHIVSGDVVLLFSFCEGMLYAEAKGFAKRSVELPITEGVIKGPREGFSEDLSQNISQIRRRIKNSKLKTEYFLVGEDSNTDVVLLYLEDKAPEALINYIRKKLTSIKPRFVLDTNYIEEHLRCKFTFFNTIGYTEKPDILSANLFQGRIAIMVDGTPFGLIAPFFFIDHFTMPDDYYNNKMIGSFDRIIRWTGFLIALLLPPMYLALTTWHFKLLPSVFLFRIAVLRAGVPYPTVFEIFIMYFFFLILRESGIRLPQPIGQAISIFGALILGEAAIGAGLTSEITVLVVALSSICTFLIPKLFNAIVFWVGLMLVFAGFLGLPGLYVAFILFISHLGGLTSCGYPYLYPLGTLSVLTVKDHIIRSDLKNISNAILDGDED